MRVEDFMYLNLQTTQWQEGCSKSVTVCDR